MLLDNGSGDIFLDVFEGAPVRRLRKGETLFHAGAAADQVFNVRSGMLMATRIGNDGRRQVLSFLFRDNFVGLSATDSYFFTVEAVTGSEVVCRPRKALEARLEQDPAAERAFLNMVFRVLENSLDLVYSLGQRTAIERLAVFLLYLRHRQKIAAGLPETSARARAGRPAHVPAGYCGLPRAEKGDGQPQFYPARPAWPHRAAR